MLSKSYKPPSKQGPPVQIPLKKVRAQSRGPQPKAGASKLSLPDVQVLSTLLSDGMSRAWRSHEFAWKSVWESIAMPQPVERRQTPHMAAETARETLKKEWILEESFCSLQNVTARILAP